MESKNSACLTDYKKQLVLIWHVSMHNALELHSNMYIIILWFYDSGHITQELLGINWNLLTLHLDSQWRKKEKHMVTYA